MRAFHNPAQGDSFYRARIGQGHVKWMVPTRNRSLFVDCAKIGLIVEEDATIVVGTETHHGFRVVKLDPKWIAGRHSNFVVSVKGDEF
jgi:hypothetical protein